ncbi:MAG TPA: PGPGW domain-containing protein [Schlesneria sp.]|jgi:uncharacterized protein (TIGR02611 family)
MEATNKPETTEIVRTTTPPANDPLKLIRQVVVFVLGMSVVIVGIAMIVLPGPATIVIPAGLAILATEFVWAKHWLNYLKRRAQQAMEWTANSVGTSTGQSPAETPQDSGKGEL